MKFHENHSLKAHNTFGLACKARFYSSFHSEEQLQLLLTKSVRPLLILGGGSNILLTQDFPGTVLRNDIKGVTVVDETARHLILKVGGGVVWDALVQWSIQRNLGGIENLSLIPGSVGAAPMQNIGAYGVELESVFEKLEAVSIDSCESRTFTHKDCQFGYRNSVFKGALKGKYVITQVFLRLNKFPVVNTSYGAIETELTSMGIDNVTVKSVSEAVINIRKRKLPNPNEIGNSGSFFKNPIISIERFNSLQARFPKIVGYPLGSQQTKVAAGWLIDQAGWKGYRKGDAGIHKNHALVLVNYGGAKGSELVDLAKQVQQSVEQKFGIALEAEVNLI